MSQKQEVIKRHYSQLVGFRIEEVIVVESPFEGESEIVAFRLKKGKQQLLVTLLSDAEGNDTGFLEITEWSDVA